MIESARNIQLIVDMFQFWTLYRDIICAFFFFRNIKMILSLSKKIEKLREKPKITLQLLKKLVTRLKQNTKERVFQKLNMKED